jgi:mono/diheme cytochrome c family protein
MRNSQYILFLVCIFSLLSAFASDNNIDGEQLYKSHCASCHGTAGGMDMSKRIAPPIAAVRMHYIGPYPDKAAFVSAIVNWVEKQDARKSLMPGAIRRFNIMPPVNVAKDDAEKIAAYIYEGNIEKPVGFDEHVEERHGK